MASERDVMRYVNSRHWQRQVLDYLDLVSDHRVLVVGPSDKSEMPNVTRSIVNLLRDVGFMPEQLDPDLHIAEKMRLAGRYRLIIAVASTVGTATEVLFFLEHLTGENAPPPIPDIRVIVPVEYDRGQFARAVDAKWDQDITLCHGLYEGDVHFLLKVLDLLANHMEAKTDEINAERASAGKRGLDDNGRRMIAQGPPRKIIDGADWVR